MFEAKLYVSDVEVEIVDCDYSIAEVNLSVRTHNHPKLQSRLQKKNRKRTYWKS